MADFDNIYLDHMPEWTIEELDYARAQRQPSPNDCWCIGCDPDCCEGCPPLPGVDR